MTDTAPTPSRIAVWWWTGQRDTPTPWDKRHLRSEQQEGRLRHLFVAILEEPSVERVWHQVFRSFPDCRQHGSRLVKDTDRLDKLVECGNSDGCRDSRH